MLTVPSEKRGKKTAFEALNREPGSESAIVLLRGCSNHSKIVVDFSIFSFIITKSGINSSMGTSIYDSVNPRTMAQRVEWTIWEISLKFVCGLLSICDGNHLSWQVTHTNTHRSDFCSLQTNVNDFFLSLHSHSLSVEYTKALVIQALWPRYASVCILIFVWGCSE